MSKKIIVLNGSPRKNGNTSALVTAFAEGAKSRGNHVMVFHLGSMDIHGRAELDSAKALGASIQ